MEERTTPRRRTQTVSAAPRPAAQTGQQPVRRRRRKPKPPVKALAICAAMIFAVGFLTGFLVRGFFLPDAEAPAEPQTQQTPGDTAPAVPSTEPSAETEPPRSEPDWQLQLVKADKPLPAEHNVDLTKLSGGAEVDRRCYSDLQNLLAACKEAGFSPVIVHGHLSAGWQTDGEAAPLPCEAEHATGLAIDIVDASSQTLDESQSTSEIGAWLAQNAWRYGFLQRYPADAAQETGVTAAPWHYRYVGTENAQAIHDAGLTLEGYLLATAG